MDGGVPSGPLPQCFLTDLWGFLVQRVKMAVVQSSAVAFRNAAYNMFFKRTSTTLMFVMGKSQDLMEKCDAGVQI